VGGRFERAPNEQFDAFTLVAFDRRLLPYEIAVDRAWPKLWSHRIFTAAEVKQTLAALDKISERPGRMPRGWTNSGRAEDVTTSSKSAGRRTRAARWKVHAAAAAMSCRHRFRLFVIDAAAKFSAASKPC